MTQRSGANTEKDSSVSSRPVAADAGAVVGANAASPAGTAAGAGAGAGQSHDAAAVAAAITLATDLISSGSPIGVDEYVTQLADAKEPVAVQAARVVEELATQKPEWLAPHIETLVTALGASRARAAEAAAHALPILARVAPAKVAKHLKTMQAAFPHASELAKDGLVRTFVALCVASVTYQKRLIENFELALRTADAKQLPGWVEHILPALKGEPYAQARSVVEQRLNNPEQSNLTRPVAQTVADLIGVKLRAAPERSK